MAAVELVAPATLKRQQAIIGIKRSRQDLTTGTLRKEKHMNKILSDQNFLSAIQHLSIGHIATRRGWVNESGGTPPKENSSRTKYLMFAHKFCGNGSYRPHLWWWRPPTNKFLRDDGTQLNPPLLLGKDKGFDIQAEDITANDWEIYEHV